MTMSALTWWNFNPRSPCGERRGQCPDGVGLVGISIHAPRAGSDGAQAAEQ